VKLCTALSGLNVFFLIDAKRSYRWSTKGDTMKFQSFLPPFRSPTESMGGILAPVVHQAANLDSLRHSPAQEVTQRWTGVPKRVSSFKILASV
jgi:hypothetical protein